MRRLILICVPVLLASCSRVGNIPNNASDAAFGGDVAGTPGASVIATIGGVEAARVATSAKAVESASNSAVASSLVKRDASGNFAANTVTATLIGNASTATSATTAGTADYALGKQGSNIPSAPILTLTGDGSFYNVTGVTAISGISPAVAGAHITLYFTSALALHHSSVLVLTGAGDYVVSVGDVFEFVSRGGGIWLETARKVSGDSYVRAVANGGIAIPANVYTVVPFTTLAGDNQAEFDTGTSTFTARQSGVYEIHAALTLFTGSFTATDYCLISIVTNTGLTNQRGAGPYGVSTNACSAAVSTTLALPAGTTVRLYAYQSSSVGTVTFATAQNAPYLTISRLRP